MKSTRSFPFVRRKTNEPRRTRPTRALRAAALAIGCIGLFQDAGAASQEPENADRLLNEHAEAMGGRRAWREVESVRLSGTIERADRNVDFVIVKKRPDRIRATLTMENRIGAETGTIQFIRVSDGEKAWHAIRPAGSVSPPNFSRLDGQDARNLKADAHVIPHLMELRRRGAKIEAKGAAAVRGRECYRLVAVPRDNARASYVFFLDADTLRPARVIERDAAGEARVTETFLRFGKFEGHLFPTLSRVVSETTGESLVRVRDAEINVGVHRHYFRAKNAAPTRRASRPRP